MKGSKAMEEIMADVRPHLLPVIDHGANGNIHHFNRVREKIEAWFDKYALISPLSDKNRCLLYVNPEKDCQALKDRNKELNR